MGSLLCSSFSFFFFFLFFFCTLRNLHSYWPTHEDCSCIRNHSTFDKELTLPVAPTAVRLNALCTPWSFWPMKCLNISATIIMCVLCFCLLNQQMPIICELIILLSWFFLFSESVKVVCITLQSLHNHLDCSLWVSFSVCIKIFYLKTQTTNN